MDITLLNDEELMQHFQKQVAWQNFFSTQVAQTEVEEADAEAHMKSVEAISVLTSEEKLTKARLERDTDDDVESARTTYRVARARRKMLLVVMENRERCASLLSRELTRRVGRDHIDRRNNRWTP